MACAAVAGVEVGMDCAEVVMLEGVVTVVDGTGSVDAVNIKYTK